MKTIKHLMLYGIFGVLTTLLDIFIYWLVSRVFRAAVVPSTIIAWFIAVLFSYYTNRKYVFQSQTKNFFAIIFEAFCFFTSRLATGVIDVTIMYLFVDVFKFDDVIVKTVSNIIVIILNYIASRLFIFKS